MKGLWFSLILFTLFSCADFKKGERVAAVESMETSLNSAQATLEENKLEDKDGILSSTQALIALAKTLEEDTIDYQFAIDLDEYTRMTKRITPLDSTYHELSQMTQQQIEVLSKLKKDIKAGTGKRHKYDEYLSHEQQKTDLITSSISEFIDEASTLKETFDKLHEPLFSTVNERIAHSEVQ